MRRELTSIVLQDLSVNRLSDEAHAVLQGQRQATHRRLSSLALLAAVAIGAFLLDLATGPSGMALSDLLRALFLPQANDSALHLIVWEIRLPQAMMALLVGMALALAGAELQAILDNPLASPFTIGAAPAASFGAAIVIVAGISIAGIAQEWLVSASAFVCALGTSMLVWAISRLERSGADRVVLLGIGLTFAFQALTAIAQYFASASALQQLVFWTMGSLAQASWPQVGILALAILILLPFSLSRAWQLTALGLGEERARSFGIDTLRLRLAALLRVSLLTATAMSFVGTIGFVGLVGPHIARLLLGGDSRFLLPGAVLTGAAMMSLASVLSKMAIPGALLPIGVVTAVIGLPIFFALVFRRSDVS